MLKKSSVAALFVGLLALTVTAFSASASGPPTELQQTPPATLTIETVVNLGVEAGSGVTPQYLAINPDDDLLYVFSEGIPAQQTGNSLNVFDTDSGEFTTQSFINEGDNEPLDLQFDGDSGQVFALWRDRYGGSRPILSVIESDNLQPVQEIPDVEAFAAAGGQLYAANADELFTVNLANNSIDEASRVSLPAGATGPMAVDTQNNRLYLARAIDGNWSIEIFEADTLAPVASYAAQSSVLDIAPHPTTGELFFTTQEANFRILYRLSMDGELADLPYELGPYFGKARIAVSPDGANLFYSNGQFRPFGPDDPTESPALIGLDTTTLTESHYIPLLNNVTDMLVDPSNQLYALAPFDNHLYLVDTQREAYEIANTKITLRDVLVEPESGNLYISDTANRIRLLDGETFDVLAETRVTDNGYDYGFITADYGGELSLDADRNRLYVSGQPGIVLEADTLTQETVLNPGGQIAPDPGGDNLYLTNCGVTALNADTLSGGELIPGSGPRPDQFVPNPCVTYSHLDAQNQWLYGIAYNGAPGSNSGNYLYVYDLALEPTLVFSDTDLSISSAQPDPDGQRAFVSYIRNSNRRLRTLDMSDSDEIGYTNQLFGLWGTPLYSPTTNRLYVGDQDRNRLLTLDADTLSVLDELPLPPDATYRLVELDPATDRLFLADPYGQLLIAAPDIEGTRTELAEALPPGPAIEATGPVLSLSGTDSGTVYSKIEAQTGDYSTEARLYSGAASSPDWTDLSQNLPPYPMQAVVASNQEQVVLASQLMPGQSGSLYQSPDEGQNWLPAMAGLGDMWVTDLYISPNFDDTGLVFAQTTYGGLHQSTDGAQTWQPLAELDPNSLFPNSTNGFATAFSDNSVLVSQDLDEMRGIYLASRKADGSPATWQQTLDIPATKLAISANGETALAFGTSLWRSTDGGQQWEIAGAGLPSLDNLQPANLFFSPDDTAYFFYTGASTATQAQLYRSLDSGLSWQPWQAPADDTIFTALTLTTDDNFLLGDTTAQLTQLSPDSLEWKSPAIPDAQFPVDTLAASPIYGSDQTLFAVSRQNGLYKTDNGGKQWQLTNFPARNYNFSASPYRLTISPNYADDQTLFAATGQSLHRSTDGGESWQQLSLGDTPSFSAQHVAMSPNFGSDDTVLAISPEAVYRSTDGGESWQQVLEADGETSSTDLLIFAPDGNTAYARFGYAHGLFISDDSGKTWQLQSANRDELFQIVSAATGPNASLSTALEYDRRLQQTDPQSQPWLDVSESLPTELTGLTAVAYDADGTLYVGGQGGVFRSADNGQIWEAVSSVGLPEGAITRLQIVEDKLFALYATGAIFAFDGAGWKDISVIK